MQKLIREAKKDVISLAQVCWDDVKFIPFCSFVHYN